MRLIYVGRLDKEKGIESIIWLIQYIVTHKINNTTIDIFGKWTYSNDILSLSKNYPTIIHYHGRKNKKDITWIWSEMDFFLMPSTFLETFGLTACESLMLGVPVIWYKKWWLLPFIDPLLTISKENNLIKIIATLQKQWIKKEQFRFLSKQTKKDYTTSKRISSSKEFLPQSENILMVSDFINYNGGGVETHIHDIKNILNNYNISLYGHQAPTEPYAKYKKLYSMLQSFFNISDSIMIIKKIKQDSIWLIRRHSISRVIGRFPLLCIRLLTWKEIKHIMTHHELWLFHPFPSQVTETSQIPKARSLPAFIKAGQSNNIIKRIAIGGKYLLIRLLHKQLQKMIKTHIVPSEWMKDMVQSRYPHAQVIIVPHFVHHIDTHL